MVKRALRTALSSCCCPAKAASQRKSSAETFHLVLTWAGEKAGGLELMASLLDDWLGRVPRAGVRRALSPGRRPL